MRLRAIAVLLLLRPLVNGWAQTPDPPQADPATDATTGAQAAADDAQNTPPPQPSPPQAPPSVPNANPAVGQQPKRILGVMPNYRAVSTGALPPPPTAKEAFIIATQNSFDYSAFVFVGVTSLWAWGDDAHPQLRSGIAGYGRYYWRGFLDKADGNYLVLFALPTLFHQDERYYTLGQGGVWKRGIYAASRTLITPNYRGRDTFNFSEVLGRAMAEAISAAYYPPGSRSIGDIAVRYGWAMGRDTLTQVFREFWPDISTKLLHMHPKPPPPAQEAPK